MPDLTKDDYDRAWDRRPAADRAAARRIGMAAWSKWASAAILAVAGFALAAVGAEALAVYNACFANALCYRGLSGDGWEGFLAFEWIGILLLHVEVRVLFHRSFTGRLASVPRQLYRGCVVAECRDGRAGHAYPMVSVWF